MADIDLQKAVDMTVVAALNGAGLHGIPDYRTIEIEIADDRKSARLVCPDHGSLIAELDANLTITVEYECVECEFYTCNDCDQLRQRPCPKHTEHDEVPA